MFLDVCINSVPVRMELDTSALLLILGSQIYRSPRGHSKLFYGKINIFMTLLERGACEANFIVYESFLLIITPTIFLQLCQL